MPLRLLEATLPHEALEQVPALVQDLHVIHVRTSGSADAIGLLSILLEAEHAEAVSDLLVSRFGTHDSFRLMLLPVEATLPAAEATSAEQTAAVEREPDQATSLRISRSGRISGRACWTGRGEAEW